MPAKYAPRVIVKFRDFLPPDLAENYNPRLYIKDSDWKDLQRQFPGITIERRLTSLSPQQLVNLVKKGKELDQDYHPTNGLFLTYFAVTEYPPLTNPQAVAARLRTLPKVELTYVEGEYSGPSGARPGTTSEDLNQQKYLSPAPDGIDAVYAWTKFGGDGGDMDTDLMFVDIEQGWLIAPDYAPPHEDLPSDISRIGPGANGGQVGHGTAVLGIVLAVPNNFGRVGIAPNVNTKMVASYLPDDVPNAMAAAISATKPGDVILLEVQVKTCFGYYPSDNGGSGWASYNDLPIEIEDLVFQQILNAKANQRIVVEAAGNGGWKLDHFTAYGWWDDTKPYEFPTRLNRNTSQFFQDSWAIMVAGSSSTCPHTRPKNTNHGSRIDCYAWGENVRTTGYNDDGSLPLNLAQSYTPFDGTSAAAAIVAGAALSVQGICHEKRAGVRFSPSELRAILSDWKRTDENDPLSGNTLSAQSTYPSMSSPGGSYPPEWNIDEIGVMPNLRAIIQNNNLILLHPPIPQDRRLPHRPMPGDPVASPIPGDPAASPTIAFLAGALIGVGAALLLAPQSGTKTRNMLRAFARAAKDKLMERSRHPRATQDTDGNRGREINLTERRRVLLNRSEEVPPTKEV